MRRSGAAPVPAASRSAQRGFTVIELMIVISIVSILAVIAIPAYMEYATRSKVSEALGFLGEAKTSVSERFYSTRKMPTENSMAGLQDPNAYDAYHFIARLEVTSTPVPGTITVTLDLPNTPADRKQLQLIPDTNPHDEIIWSCKPAPAPDGVDTKYVPANCRQG